ncbi:MAG TPA: SDR family NAD(P)-dependent oxidoreductase [Acidimicrobiales bacterium]|nr:SDR family NAD(P)-dependent oxidoreductase [Acidimicrobiales bacterium]
MQDVVGRVAVVTGAASGIGRAMIDRFAAADMKVVLADIEAEALDKAEAEVRSAGAETLSVVTDVSSRSSVDALAAAVVDRFGGVHVLCNNAGVSGGFGGALWDTTERDWAWVMGVNLMGVVHGIQAFLPGMVARGEPGHVVNTSSVLGLATGGGSIYGVTKHAVTRLSEGLWYDLRAAGAPIGVSVLCPGMIATQIISSGRNRPDELRNDADPTGPEVEQRVAMVQQLFAKEGMPPSEVADLVFDAVLAEKFSVLTHPEAEKETVRARFEAILAESDPPPPRTDGGFMSMGRRRPS